MIDYSSWPHRNPDVLDIQLDKLNPRIPFSTQAMLERDLIEQLIEFDDVLELAKSIGTQGYFPTEVVVCVEEDGALVVAEGNRRVAALKLLHSPEMAPAKYLKQATALSSKYRKNVPDEIAVVVAPNRADTVPLIMNRHTRVNVKGWEPLQQAQYVHNLLAAGLTLDQIVTLTSIPRADIVANLRTNSLYEMAKRLPLNKGTASIVGDTRKFSASILERVSGSPDFRDFLGIDFDAQGRVVGKVDPEEFKEAFSRIVEDIAHKRVDTRLLNKAEDVRRYIGQLSSVKPDKKKKGAFTSDDFLSPDAEPEEPENTDIPKPDKKPRVQKALIARSLRCNLKMQRIHDVLKELQKLEVANYENAVGILLRIFIELSVCHYMDSTGQLALQVELINAKSKQKKSADWTPTLRQMLGYIMAKDTELIAALPRQAIKAINKAISDDDYSLSLDGMDQFAHNPYVAPSERQLRQIWNAFEAMLNYMMQERKPMPIQAEP